MARGIRTLVLAAACAGAGLALFAAADLPPAGVVWAQDRPPPERRFRIMDTNRDGRLTRDEFRGPPQAFDRADANRDGVLTLDEFVAFVNRRAGQAPDQGPRREAAPPGRREARPAAPAPAQPAPATPGPGSQVALPVIDTHAHLRPGRRREGGGLSAAASAAVAAMDRLGIRTTIVMTPPLPSSHVGRFDEDALFSLERDHPGRFVVMGGGASLNPMIHDAPKDGSVSPELRRRFQDRAEAMLRQGAVGFGEVTALHFSFYSQHPFEERAPDHPLFLLLADIAARHGVPIDLHMEAVAAPFELPKWLRERSGSNPARIEENIGALERLLSHNRQARIIWAHVGMDTTNQRSPELMRRLFGKHPNLYTAIKIAPLPGTVHWIVRAGSGLNPAWRAVMLEFPDRFLIGSDEFYMGEGVARRQRPQSTAGALEVLKHLPPAVARKIAYENAQSLYRIGAAR